MLGSCSCRGTYRTWAVKPASPAPDWALPNVMPPFFTSARCMMPALPAVDTETSSSEHEDDPELHRAKQKMVACRKTMHAKYAKYAKKWGAAVEAYEALKQARCDEEEVAAAAVPPRVSARRDSDGAPLDASSNSLQSMGVVS